MQWSLAGRFSRTSVALNLIQDYQHTGNINRALVLFVQVQVENISEESAGEGDTSQVGRISGLLLLCIYHLYLNYGFTKLLIFPRRR